MPWLILLGLGAYFGYKHLQKSGASHAVSAAPTVAPVQDATYATAYAPPPTQDNAPPPQDDGGAPSPAQDAGGGGGYADPGPGTATSAPTPTPAPAPSGLDPAKVANVLANVMATAPAAPPAPPPLQVMAAKLTTPQGFADSGAPPLATSFAPAPVAPAPSAPLTTTLGALAALKGKK